MRITSFEHLIRASHFRMRECAQVHSDDKGIYVTAMSGDELYLFMLSHSGNTLKMKSEDIKIKLKDDAIYAHVMQTADAEELECALITMFKKSEEVLDGKSYVTLNSTRPLKWARQVRMNEYLRNCELGMRTSGGDIRPVFVVDIVCVPTIKASEASELQTAANIIAMVADCNGRRCSINWPYDHEAVARIAWSFKNVEGNQAGLKLFDEVYAGLNAKKFAFTKDSLIPLVISLASCITIKQELWEKDPDAARPIITVNGMPFNHTLWL